MQLCLGIIVLPTDHITISNTEELCPWGYRRFGKQCLWNGVASAHTGPVQGPKVPQELQHPVTILTWELVPRAEQFPRAEISKYIFPPWLWHLLGNFKLRNVCATVQAFTLAQSCPQTWKPWDFSYKVWLQLRGEQKGAADIQGEIHVLGLCTHCTLQNLRHWVTVSLLNRGKRTILLNKWHTSVMIQKG